MPYACAQHFIQRRKATFFSGLLLNQKKKTTKNKAWTSTLLCMANLHTVFKNHMQGSKHGSLLPTMRYSLTFLQNVSLYHYKLYAPKWDLQNGTALRFVGELHHASPSFLICFILFGRKCSTQTPPTICCKVLFLPTANRKHTPKNERNEERKRYLLPVVEVVKK